MKLLVFIILFVQCIYGDTLSVSDHKNIYNNFTLKYLNDINASLTIDEIAQKKFSNTTPNSYTLGYQKGSVWFQLSLENKSKNEEFILTLNEHFYEKADLYFYQEGRWFKKELSLFTPIEKREVKNNKLSFVLNIAPDAKQDYYLEIQGKYAYFGDITLYEKSYFYYDKQIDINSVAIYILGIISIIILFNIFLYLKIKEKIYLYYVSYSFFNFVFLLNISGLLVYIGLQHLIYPLNTLADFFIDILIFFLKGYLGTKMYFTSVDKILKILVSIFLLLGVLVVYSYQPWNKLINNFSGAANIILIVASIIIYFKGYTSTKYYIFAMLLYFVFVVLFTFMVMGIFPYNDITRYGFFIASGVEVVIFSLIIANRYNDIRQEHQQYLENEIDKRTSELTCANEKLKTLIDERELLLKEVYHRVKNNFHIVIGMLWFEGNKKDADTQQFAELTNRIKSMSMIHEYLYNSKDLVNINLKEYLDKIVYNINCSYKKIAIDIRVEDIIIKFDNAVSLGILLNEIITNALKHNNIDGLFLSIELTQENNRIYLKIQDNGRGFKNTKENKGLGLKLVDQFCKKLPKSKYKFSFENGTKFELEFARDED